MSDTTFPSHPDALTVDWLDSVLHDAGAIGADEHIEGFTTAPLGEGFGMLGQLCRLSLRSSGGNGSLRSVIYKCATASEGNRAVATAFDMYNREISFYQLLSPTVAELVPTCYFAEQEAGGNFALLIEDLADYRRGDQAAGCGLDDAEMLVDALATLHSRWWDRTGDANLTWVPRPDGAMYKVGMVAGTEAGWAPTIATFGHLLDPELAAAGPRYIAALPSLHDRMGSGHQTFLHGDFRLDNLLFSPTPSKRPLVIVDWQGCIVSKGPQDLAYLLTQNVTTDIRRIHERDLVARYHAGLMDQGVIDYSLEECWDDYRLSALWLWEYAIVIAGTLDPANERGVAFMAGLVGRAAATIMDLRLLDLIP